MGTNRSGAKAKLRERRRRREEQRLARKAAVAGQVPAATAAKTGSKDQ